MDKPREGDSVECRLEVKEGLVEAGKLLGGGMGGEGVGDGAKAVSESSLGMRDVGEGRQGVEEGEEDALEDLAKHVGEGDRTEVGNDGAVGLFRDGECESRVPLGGGETGKGTELGKEGEVLRKRAATEGVQELHVDAVCAAGSRGRIPCEGVGYSFR